MAATKAVIFDIETIPDMQRRNRFELKEPRLDYNFSAGISGGEHVQKSWSSKAIEAEYVKQMSVTPEFCQIIGLGYYIEGDEPRAVYVGDIADDGTEITEGLLLKKFWWLFDTCYPRVGYNIIGFDIPVILIRSFIHELRPSRSYNPGAKPWETPFIDLMRQRFPPSGWGALSMKVIAKALISPEEIPEKYKRIEDMDGGEVYELWQASKRDELRLYLEFDVWREMWLYQNWQGYFF